MNDFGGSFGAGRFSRARGRIQGGQGQGINYPSPFFDVAHTYLPTTVKQMFRWCRYYFFVHPLINAAIFKMSQYPITDLVYFSKDPQLKDMWKNFLETQLMYRGFQEEVGLDHFCYGNALISIFFPFIKMLECRECHYSAPAKTTNYYFRNFQFYWQCPRCQQHGEAKVHDNYVKSSRGIRLLRWNPEDIDIRYNDLNGEYTFFYEMPVQLKNDIIMGKKNVVEEVPQVFIEALQKRKAVVLSRDNVYHFKRPTLAGKDRGWGIPLLLPVLKDAFYLQVMKKAQECVSLSSLLETKNGLLRADDVDVGGQVRTHTGQWQRVEEKWYRDAREGEIGRKIILTGLRSFSATYSPQHPIFTIRRNEENRRIDTKDAQRSSVILRNPHLYEEVLCPAEQLEIGQYVLYPRALPSYPTDVDVAAYTGLTTTDGYVYSGCGEETAVAFEALERGEHVFHDNAGRVAKRTMKEGRTPKRMASVRAMTTDFAYILGWYAGDGSCGSRHVGFSLGKDNDAKPLMDAIRQEFGIEPTIEEGVSINTVVLSDTIVRHLIKGMIPGTARHKRAPIEILDGVNEVKLAYLRGLWDADRCRGVRKGSVSTSSREQAYDVYRLLLHFGCIATVDKLGPKSSIINGKEVRGSGSYNVNTCGASFARLRSLWECGTGPEVASGKSGFFWKEYFATRICAVEEVEEDQYIDFKIANDTTFCTPGTATKNSILLEHIVPLRVLFPQAGSATSDPFTSINLGDWKDHIADEINHWRVDQNYIPILPLPIGQQTIGGDGRALLLGQEIRVWSEQIITGMGFPQELIFGGVSFSGSNVSLRMLENFFLGYMINHRRLLHWVMNRISSYMNWSMIDVRFKPFKMADDLQRKAYNFQLNQAGKISDGTLLADADFDAEKEDEAINLETARRAESMKKSRLSQAEIEGEAQMVMTRYQLKSQKEQAQMQASMTPAPGEPGAEAEGVAEGGMPQPVGEQQAQPGQPQGQPQEQPAMPGAMSAFQSPLTLGAQQPAPTSPEQAGALNIDLLAAASQLAHYLAKLDDRSRQMALQNLQTSSPELYETVVGMLNSLGVGQQAPAGQPLPEQRLPTRSPGAALI